MKEQRGRLQQKLASRVGTEGRTPVALPQDWPARIRCPHCKEWQDATEYQVLSRKQTLAEGLNLILLCKRPGCIHAFSPTAVYFDQHKQASTS